LEALITKDEETGMYGAFGLKPGTLNGEILLNLDSEDEGELYISFGSQINEIKRLLHTILLVFFYLSCFYDNKTVIPM
jgi:hypothetical protein